MSELDLTALRREFKPQRIRHDRSGIPITYDNFVDEDGYEVGGDPWVEAMVLRTRRCGICGDPLHGEVAFIGSPPHADKGLFYTPGLHVDCARYAFDVCPFLATPGWSLEGRVRRQDFPEQFTLHVTTGYRVLWHRFLLSLRESVPNWGYPIVKAKPPYLVEFHTGRRSMIDLLNSNGGRCPHHRQTKVTGCPHHGGPSA